MPHTSPCVGSAAAVEASTPAGGGRGRGTVGASIAAVVGVGRKRVGRKRQREEGSDCAREGGRDRGRKRVGRPAAPKTLSSYIYV